MTVETSVKGPLAAEATLEELLQSATRCWKAGRTTEAEGLCRRILQRNPAHAEAFCLLGRISTRLGNLGLAAAFFAKAVALSPNEPSYYSRLGVIYLRQNQLQRAAEQFQRALELDPHYSRAYANLGVVYLNEGRVSEAIGYFRKGLKLHPDDADVHTNLLFALHYLTDSTRAELCELARDWGRRHATVPTSQQARFRNIPAPERPLRVGYVSGNFGHHPVGFFLEPILVAHHREAFEIYCYANRHTVDATTERLCRAADHWRNVTELSDEEAVDLIRRDEIDVLVDLSGHTSWHRLRMFARRAAPVQASWLGYFDTTGVPEMDYLIADRFVCPPGDEPYYVERLARLPDSFLCYSPPTLVEVGALPALRHGRVTFGCFNKLAKVTPQVIATWSQILRALPGSRLILKDGGLEHAAVRDRLLQVFSQQQIGKEQLDLRGRSTHPEYLAAFGDVDIALDPFPYNGGTTTLDALWMGVPVVSLAGDRFASRMGLAHLTTAGLEELVARTRADYVALALALAGDTPRLAQLRCELRERVRTSPLCDSRRFVAGLEAIYREMWRSWCRRVSAKESQPDPGIPSREARA